MEISEFFERFVPLRRQMAERLSRAKRISPVEAEDIVSDSMMKARFGESYTDRIRFDVWLWIVVKRTWVDRCRKRARAGVGGVDIHIDELDTRLSRPITPQPDEAPIVAETRTAVWEEITLLPAEDRWLIDACYFHGHTDAQAAALLGLPRTTVASRHARILTKLRSALRKRGCV
jgi:RNA polymerase sigma factor (sigma-70 family)